MLLPFILLIEKGFIKYLQRFIIPYEGIINPSKYFINPFFHLYNLLFILHKRK